MDVSEINKISQWLQTGSINIFGLPFSGKDTHAAEIQKLFNASVISGGDILRSSIGPKHIQDHIGKGNLAPTDEYLEIVLPFLARQEYNGKPLILSSVGRWHGEEQSVMKAAKESGHPIKAVIYLSINETESKIRWKLAERGREDDAAEHVLKNRFNEFRQKTLPVINYYKRLGLLIEVDGMPAKDVVTSSILLKLSILASPKSSLS